jgi:hypothetical protein
VGWSIPLQLRFLRGQITRLRLAQEGQVKAATVAMELTHLL